MSGAFNCAVFNAAVFNNDGACSILLPPGLVGFFLVAEQLNDFIVAADSGVFVADPTDNSLFYIEPNTGSFLIK